MSFHGWEKVNLEQALDLLKNVQELFTDEKKWIYWPIAQNDKSIEVQSIDPSATQFCLMGALESITQKKYEQPLASYIECATFEYLDDLSGNELMKGKFSYKEEVTLIAEAIKELEKDVKTNSK